MDPCDPRKRQKPPFEPKFHPKGGGQSKQNKKGKRKTTQEKINKVRKLWCEAQSPEGYSYYWNIETNGKIYFLLHLNFFIPKYESVKGSEVTLNNGLYGFGVMHRFI